jgi:hypothetical protein
MRNVVSLITTFGHSLATLGATRVPGDQEANQQQAIVQPGQTFTPNFEPHGVIEAALKADLYGWHVEEKRQ